MWPVIPTATLLLMLEQANQDFYQGTPDFTKLKLYVNDVSPDEASNVGQFSEPTYTGYAAVNLTMNNPAINDQGLVVSQSNLCTFRVTLSGGSDVVYGIFLEAPGGVLISATRFDTPQPMSDVNDTIVGIWRNSMPQSNYGWISVE